MKKVDASPRCSWRWTERRTHEHEAGGLGTVASRRNLFDFSVQPQRRKRFRFIPRAKETRRPPGRATCIFHKPSAVAKSRGKIHHKKLSLSPRQPTSKHDNPERRPPRDNVSRRLRTNIKTRVHHINGQRGRGLAGPLRFPLTPSLHLIKYCCCRLLWGARSPRNVWRIRSPYRPCERSTG